MFLRAPETLEEAGATAEVAVDWGFFSAGLLRKNLDRLRMVDLLLSALWSVLIDSAMADAAVRTVRKRSSGSIVSSLSVGPFSNSMPVVCVQHRAHRDLQISYFVCNSLGVCYHKHGNIVPRRVRPQLKHVTRHVGWLPFTTAAPANEQKLRQKPCWYAGNTWCNPLLPSNEI
jgi:hypothetical protein